jgi:hypothetical protein
MDLLFSLLSKWPNAGSAWSIVENSLHNEIQEVLEEGTRVIRFGGRFGDSRDGKGRGAARNKTQSSRNQIEASPEAGRGSKLFWGVAGALGFGKKPKGSPSPSPWKHSPGGGDVTAVTVSEELIDFLNNSPSAAAARIPPGKIRTVFQNIRQVGQAMRDIKRAFAEQTFRLRRNTEAVEGKQGQVIKR